MTESAADHGRSSPSSSSRGRTTTATPSSALERLGADARASGTPTTALPAETSGVVLPGGFSYGDYLRCGAIARFSPMMKAVADFAADGGLVLGICNGFQILTEAGLLPGALRPNESLSFVCRDVAAHRRAHRHPVHVALRGRPDAHDPGQARRRLLVRRRRAARTARGERPARAPLRAPARTRTARSPTSPASCNDDGNVFGLMPHPEHAVDPLLGSTDGALILGSLVDAARLSLAAAV